MDGELFTVCGASRSGKSVFVMERTRARQRVIVWDIEGQYEGQRVTNKAELLRVIKAKAGADRARICYTGALADFDFFCRCAFVFVRAGYLAGLASCVIVEELADVTSPGKAPEGWGVLIRRGLKYGADIFAITQRPSESDKTSLGNSSLIHCCRLSSVRDCRYMADMLALHPDQVQALKSEKTRLEFIQRDMRTGKNNKGFLSFKGRKPVFTYEKAKK